jgi:hypothetical protein
MFLVNQLNQYQIRKYRILQKKKHTDTEILIFRLLRKLRPCYINVPPVANINGDTTSLNILGSVCPDYF